MLEAAVDDTGIYLDRIDLIVSNLRKSKLGGALIEFGLLQEVSVLFYEDMGPAVFCGQNVMGPPTIDINESLDNHAATVVLAHELCHVEQSILSPLPHTLRSSTDAIKLLRIFEAVASTVSVGVAYELYQETGETQYLDAFAEWEEEDIRDSFLDAAGKTLNIHANPEPFIAGFNAWFTNPERLAYYDTLALESHSEYLQNNIFDTTIQDSPLTFEMFKDIGFLFQNVNFLDKINEKTPLLQAPLYVSGVQKVRQDVRMAVPVSRP